jgi:hypothetical protein
MHLYVLTCIPVDDMITAQRARLRNIVMSPCLVYVNARVLYIQERYAHFLRSMRIPVNPRYVPSVINVCTYAWKGILPGSLTYVVGYIVW